MKKLIAIMILAILCFAGTVRATSSQLASNGLVQFANGGSLTYAPPNSTLFGYSTHPPSTDPTLSTYYSKLLAAGATWQRTDLAWDSVQSTSSISYVWGPWDTRVNEAVADGINTIFIIDQTPTWGAYFNCSSGAGTCAPADATTLATFCTAAAAHFNGKISYWEIWNEQNSNGNWGPAATSSDYVAALNACGSAIKAVNPSATIISGGLDSNSAITGITADQSVTDYMADGANFDMLALHPYTYDATVNDPTFGWSEANKTYPVRALLNGNLSYASKKIIITEYGAPTCAAANHTLGSQKVQADALIATSTGSDYASLNLFKIIFWYTLVDANSNDTSTVENCFGAYFSSGNAKPVWGSLRTN